MNNNFRLLLSLVTLFLILLISGFSFILVNQKITVEEEPWGWCGTVDNTPDFPAYHQGQALFKANCATCHNKNMKADMTGPALGGVLQRWNGDTTQLYSFIRNSQAYLAYENDPYALALYEEWAKLPMLSFPYLTNENIDAILEYIEAHDTYQY